MASVDGDGGNDHSASAAGDLSSQCGNHGLPGVTSQTYLRRDSANFGVSSVAVVLRGFRNE